MDEGKGRVWRRRNGGYTEGGREDMEEQGTKKKEGRVQKRKRGGYKGGGHERREGDGTQKEEGRVRTLPTSCCVPSPPGDGEGGGEGTQEKGDTEKHTKE